MVRALQGDYALCRRCDESLEADIAEWANRVSDGLDLLVVFDAYCAERESGKDSSDGV